MTVLGIVIVEIFGQFAKAILFILTSQYHNPQTPDKVLPSAAELGRAMEEAETSGKNVVLLETDDLYIYYANCSDISFVAGDRPSKDDESIQLCVAAAFPG